MHLLIILFSVAYTTDFVWIFCQTDHKYIFGYIKLEKDFTKYNKSVIIENCTSGNVDYGNAYSPDAFCTMDIRIVYDNRVYNQIYLEKSNFTMKTQNFTDEILQNILYINNGFIHGFIKLDKDFYKYNFSINEWNKIIFSASQKIYEKSSLINTFAIFLLIIVYMFISR